jgi:hypothetical protein
MKTIKAILASLLALGMVASAFAQNGDVAKLATGPGSVTAAPAPSETLIKNATIMTASPGTINNGSILIRDRKIAEVGPNVKARDALAGSSTLPVSM